MIDPSIPALPPRPARRSALVAVVLGLGRLLFERPRPLAALILSASMIGTFVAVEAAGDSENGLDLLRFGSLQAQRLWLGESWRLVTSVFLHAGFTHLAMNLLGLVLLGAILERRVGRTTFLIVFAVSALVGDVLFAFGAGDLFFLPRGSSESCVGASGGIYGLFGALLALYPSPRGSSAPDPRFDRRFWTLSAMLCVLDVLTAYVFGIGIALEAHWGGYLAGAFTGWLIEGGARTRRVRIAAGVASSAILSVATLYAHRPFLDPSYHRYLADLVFLESGAREAREEYLALADRGIEGAGVRLAYADYEEFGPARALERLDVLDSAEKERWMALYLRVLALDELGRSGEADPAFERLVETAGAGEGGSEAARLLATNNLAMLGADHRRNLEDGLGGITRVILRVRQAAFHDTFGWVQVRAGRPKLGLVALEEAWKEYPMSEVAYHLAEAYRATGDVSRAREHAELALERDRQSTLGEVDANLFDIVQARRLLAELAGGARPR